ncbi:MAG: glutamate 5-kinase, partial [Planctomycetes bacterium]|nr:glutamate 5-kinase [Planctomycetota bacterium]
MRIPRFPFLRRAAEFFGPLLHVVLAVFRAVVFKFPGSDDPAANVADLNAGRRVLFQVRLQTGDGLIDFCARRGLLDDGAEVLADIGIPLAGVFLHRPFVSPKSEVGQFRHFIAGDFDDRIGYLNVRNTLFSLLQFGAIPIINENDTVAVDELMATFGDNDRLAAMVTNLLQAPLLVILSDVEGLYDRDPADPEAKVIPTVTQLDEAIRCLVFDKKSGLSKGGMASKLEAARIATTAGENVIIADGHQSGVLTKILSGQTVGTLFMAQGKSIAPRKRWIGFSVQPRGQLQLDAGAQQAIVKNGSSLLAIGIVAVQGDFQKGDVVALVDEKGREFARGLTNYSADEINR